MPSKLGPLARADRSTSRLLAGLGLVDTPAAQCDGARKPLRRARSWAGQAAGARQRRARDSWLNPRCPRQRATWSTRLWDSPLTTHPEEYGPWFVYRSAPDGFNAYGAGAARDRGACPWGRLAAAVELATGHTMVLLCATTARVHNRHSSCPAARAQLALPMSSGSAEPATLCTCAIQPQFIGSQMTNASTAVVVSRGKPRTAPQLRRTPASLRSAACSRCLFCTASAPSCCWRSHRVATQGREPLRVCGAVAPVD